MKIFLKIIITLIILIIIGVGVMFAFKICPPSGPWIMPPWCKVEIQSGQTTQASFYVTIPSDLAGAEVKLVIPKHEPVSMQPVGEFSYQTEVTVVGQEEISYAYQVNGQNFDNYQITITQDNQKIYNAIPETKEFKPTLGIYMMDTWGRNYNFRMLENTRNHIKDSMRRVADLGAQEVFVTDFHRAVYHDGNFSLTNTNYNIEPEIFGNDFRDEMMTQKDLDQLAEQAHKNNLKIGWRTSFHFWDIGKYVGKSDISSLVAADFAEFNKPKNEQWVKDFLGKYKQLMLNKAEMLNQAGFDYMILTPGYMTPDYQPYNQLADQLWQEIIKEVKNTFNGQVGVVADGYALLDGHDDNSWWNTHQYYQQADILFHEFIQLPDNYKAKDNDFKTIKLALEKYYQQINKSALQHKLRLSATARFPSYTDSINQDYETNDTMYPKIKALETSWSYQVKAYEAWFLVVQNLTQFDRAILAGYWWDDAMDPETAKTFVSKSGTPRNKPAEAVIKKWGRRK